MPALRWRLNYRTITLTEARNTDGVAVRLDSGRYTNLLWLGFVDLDLARKTPGAQPVKLRVSEATDGDAVNAVWYPVPEGKHVQGCRVSMGVYGVTVNGRPRLV